MHNTYIITLAFTLFLSPGKLHGQLINAITADGKTPQLGSSYDFDREIFIGGGCVQGKIVHDGISHATFSFDQTLSKKAVEDQLGFTIGGKARFGTVNVSTAATFMKNSISSAYSISAVWLSEYHLPSDLLEEVDTSSVGNRLFTDYGKWTKTCGDAYVGEIIRGAKLFFSIRVDFSSLEAKKSFEAEFNLSGKLYSASATLKTASSKYSRDAKITISALQIGGDVTQLTGVFGDTDTSSLRIVKCGLGDFDQCASVIEQALTYATQKMPTQLKTGHGVPAPLAYRVIPYSAAGIYPNENRISEDQLKRQRRSLGEEFEKQLRLSVTVERLLDLVLDNSFRTKLIGQKQLIDENLENISEAAKISFDEPEKTTNALALLKVTPVDTSVFILPPLPTAEFRLSTTIKGILSRQESVDSMAKDAPLLYSIDTNITTRPYLVSDVKFPNDEVSAVLYVRGQALKHAEIYFVNRLLSTIPLRKSEAKFPEKIGNDFATIVTATTRTYPGWQDVDIDKLRKELANADLPTADGMFYVLIVDEFGRKVKFDICHSGWGVTEGDNNTKFGTYTEYIDWWDPNSNGTNGQRPPRGKLGGPLFIPKH